MMTMSVLCVCSAILLLLPDARAENFFYQRPACYDLDPNTGAFKCFPPVQGVLPQEPSLIDFHIYTSVKTNLNIEVQLDDLIERNILSQGVSQLKLAVTTKILLLDFYQKSADPLVTDLREAIIDKEIPVNVITLEWGDTNRYLPSGKEYPQAAANAQVVADIAAMILEALNAGEKYNIGTDQMEMIGVGIGAHIAGMAGQKIFSQVSTKVHRITALDSAGQSFVDAELSARLDSDDAVNVQTLQTNAGFVIEGRLGTSEVTGAVDIVVGDGVSQLGCSSAPEALDPHCSHERAIEVYTYSIKGSTNGGCDFQAESCTWINEGCSGTVNINIGYNNNPSNGVYKLTLGNSTAPYC